MAMTTSAGEISPVAGGRRRSGRAAADARRPVPLKWINAFETGSNEIDALHRKLVQGCNSLLLLVEDKATWPLIVTAARELVTDCIAHFQVEERLLDRTRFPRRAAHVAEHRRMAADMRKLVDQMEQVDGSRPEHRDYPLLLAPSLIDFIIRHDLDFRSHLLHQQGR